MRLATVFSTFALRRMSCVLRATVHLQCPHRLAGSWQAFGKVCLTLRAKVCVLLNEKRPTEH